MSLPVQGESDRTRHEASSALVRLCLPQAMSDGTRKLAYANSICALFLIIGLIGIKPPQVARHEAAEVSDTVPVIFTPPDSAPPPPEEPKPDESSASDAPTDTPQVAAVVAASTADVAFSVPVEGNVIVAASAQFVSGPSGGGGSSGSRTGNRPAGPVLFSGGGDGSGNYPSPEYPKEELKAGHSGNVMLYAIIAPDGSFEKLEIKDSCGFNSLDKITLRWIKLNWHFPPGERREYLIPWEWKLESR